MEGKLISAMLHYFFFGTSCDRTTISCSCLGLQSKPEVKSSSRLVGGSNMGGCQSFVPWARVPCAGQGPLMLSPVWTQRPELTQRSAPVMARPKGLGVWWRRREPRRHASWPRGCAPLRLAVLVRETQGFGALGAGEGGQLCGGIEGKRRPSCGGRTRKVLLSWEGWLAGFVYHHFWKYSETMTTACQLACFESHCHILK